MEIHYSPEARQRTDGLALLESASTLLSEILPVQSSQLVKAAWNRVQDHQGRTLYRLTLQDFSGEASTDFTTDDLQNSLHMQVRLSRLWGDLLQIRNNQQHQKVQAISNQVTFGGLTASGLEAH